MEEKVDIIIRKLNWRTAPLGAALQSFELNSRKAVSSQCIDHDLTFSRIQIWKLSGRGEKELFLENPFNFSRTDADNAAVPIKSPRDHEFHVMLQTGLNVPRFFGYHLSNGDNPIPLFVIENIVPFGEGSDIPFRTSPRSHHIVVKHV